MMPRMKKLVASLVISSLTAVVTHAAESESSIDRIIDKLNATFDRIASQFSTLPEPKPFTPTWESFSLTPYKKLQIGQGIRLLVDAKPIGTSNSKVKSKGTELRLLTPYVTAHIDRNTLVITARRHSDAKYNVQLNTIEGVEVIDAHDNAIITGHKIQHSKKPLMINNEDSANVTLDGMVNLGGLHQSSTGKTQILWVDADTTALNVYNGTINLAGSNKNTIIWAYGNSVINAPHLRSDNMWLSAAGNTRSNLNPTGYFYAHGTDNALLTHRGRFDTISRVLNQHANLIYSNLDTQ